MNRRFREEQTLVGSARLRGQVKESLQGAESRPRYQEQKKALLVRAFDAFGIKGGFDANVKFYDALELFLRLVNVGDVKSLAAHPALTMHRQLSKEVLETAGVTPDMIRLCIGIEHIDDFLADIDQALDAAMR